MSLLTNAARKKDTGSAPVLALHAEISNTLFPGTPDQQKQEKALYIAYCPASFPRNILVIIHMDRLQDWNDLVPESDTLIKELHTTFAIVQQTLAQIMRFLQLEDFKLLACSC